MSDWGTLIDEALGSSSPFSASPALLSAQIQQESAGNPNAVSPKGAFGLAQLMPGTAKDPGFGITPLQNNTPEENLRLGKDYLNAMLKRYNGDQTAALVAYNWGPGNADKWVAGGKNVNALPRETRDYVSKILSNTAQPMTLAPPEMDMARDPSQKDWGSLIDSAITSKPQTPQGSSYQPTPWSQIAEDAARGTISGGIEGLTATAGLPGDVEHYLANKAREYGVPESAISAVKQVVPNSPTTQTIKGILPLGLGDASYTPTTGAGEIAQTVAGFAPAALGSGGGLGRQAANTVIAALGSKSGGDIGNMISPEAGMVGSVAGAMLTGGRLSKPEITGKAPAITAADQLASKTNMVTSPGTEAVKRVSQEAYDQIEKAGVAIPFPIYNRFQHALNADPELKTLHFDPQANPALAKLLGKITDPMAAMTNAGGSPGNISFRQFDDARRQALKISMRDADPNRRRLAGAIVDKMDTFFDNYLKPANPVAAQAVQTARNNWRMYRKSETLDQIMESAKDTGGQFSVSGNENAIRTGFRQLSKKINRDPRERARWTPAEVGIIRQLSRGWQSRDALKNIGRILNNPFVKGAGLLGGAGAMYEQGQIDPTLAAVLYGLHLVGKGARATSGVLAQNKANMLGKLVRSGGKMTQPTGVTLPILGDTRMFPLASGLAALNQQR